MAQASPTSFPPDQRRQIMATMMLLFAVMGAASAAASSSSSSEWRNLTHLPGFNGPLPFGLETGYVDVDEELGIRLFYFFVPSQRRPESDPLLLWLTGGPGCSALTALMFGIGPLNFDFDGYGGGFPTLLYKAESWTKASSVIFIDSPVGTGFSYSTTHKGYRTNEFEHAHRLFVFLSKWLKDHPEFQSNPFYAAGDSYGGMIVPLVALEIARGNEAGVLPLINLKGYLAGNPITDRRLESAASVDFRHGMALIPDELYEMLLKNCKGDYTTSRNSVCIRCNSTMFELVRDIEPSNILEPHCEEKNVQSILLASNRNRREMLARRAAGFLKSDIPFGCRNYGYELARIWANDEHVRKAIGVHKGAISSWVRCRDYLPYDYLISSGVEYHFQVLKKGYRALLYSGDHDMVVPFMSTEQWIKSFNFSIVDDWRPWYVDGYVAGFTRAYSGNVIFATVKGAGHTAPEYKPKECLSMFERWVSTSPL